MSAPIVGRDERSRSTAPIALLVVLAACTDPTTSARVTERTGAVAAVVASATPTAFAIGNITGYGVNDAGTIVGPSSGRTSSAYLWDASTNLKLLGTGGFAWSIAEDGHTVGGKNAAGLPVVWTATSLAGQWTESPIPDAGFGGAVRAIASGVSGAPLVMTGNVWTNGSIKTPARWTPCTGGSPCENGWLLSTVTLTLPIREAWGQDINPGGMIVGMEGTGCCRAAFWDANDGQSILQALVPGAAAAAWGLNDAGTIIVGQSNDVAVAWVRSSTSVDFATVAPIPLEATNTCKGNAGSIAYAVNPDFGTSGTIVGQACGVPVAWKVDVTVPPASIVKVVLPSTGRSTAGEALSINRSTSGSRYRIVGDVNGAGAYWTNF
jgi:hypothetical protein